MKAAGDDSSVSLVQDHTTTAYAAKSPMETIDLPCRNSFTPRVWRPSRYSCAPTIIAAAASQSARN